MTWTALTSRGFADRWLLGGRPADAGPGGRSGTRPGRDRAREAPASFLSSPGGGRPVAGCEQGRGRRPVQLCRGVLGTDFLGLRARVLLLTTLRTPSRPPTAAPARASEQGGASGVGTGGSGAGWWPWGSRRTRPALGSSGNFLYENGRASSTGPVPTPGTGGVPPCANRFLASSCIENQSNQKSVITARLALLETRCVTK